MEYSNKRAVAISVSHPNTCCDPKYQECLSISYHSFCQAVLMSRKLHCVSFSNQPKSKEDTCLVTQELVSSSSKTWLTWNFCAHGSLCLEFWWFLLQCSLARPLQKCLFLRYPKSSCTRFHVKICISLLQFPEDGLSPGLATFPVFSIYFYPQVPTLPSTSNGFCHPHSPHRHTPALRHHPADLQNSLKKKNSF